MRWRKADLRRRVNGKLALRFAQRGLTSYGGLEFVRRYFDLLGVVPLLRRELGSGLPRSDFGVPAMVLVLLTLVISGGRLIFQGEKGHGVGTVLRSPSGDRVMDVEATLSDNSTLTAKLSPRP